MKKIVFGLLLLMDIVVSHAQVSGDKVIVHIGGHVFTVDGNIDLGTLGNSQTITKGDSTITKYPNVTIITNAKKHIKEIYINGGMEDFSFGPQGNYMNLRMRVDSMLSDPRVWSQNMPNFSFNWNNGNFQTNMDSFMNNNRKWIDSMTHNNWSGNMPQTHYYNYNNGEGNDDSGFYKKPQHYYYHYNNREEDNDTNATRERLQEKIKNLQEKLDDMQEKVNDMNEQLNEQGKGKGVSAVQQDTTRVRVGNLRIIVNHNGVQINPHDTAVNNAGAYKHEKEIRTHWILLDVGFNTYLNNFSTNLPGAYSPLELIPGKSINVNLQLFQQAINLYQQHLFFAYGVGFEFNNYRFRQNTTLVPKSDSVQFAETSTALSKDKLSDTYLTVPIMFQYESSTNYSKSFRVAVGMNVGYLIASHTKQVSSEYGKVKVWDDYDLNTFRFGPTLRIGFSWFNLYANYSIDGLFHTGSAPVLNPFSFGISVIPD